jgi:hypothetical protein
VSAAAVDRARLLAALDAGMQAMYRVDLPTHYRIFGAPT